MRACAGGGGPGGSGGAPGGGGGPAADHSPPPKPGPADPNSWIFQLGVSPKKEEEEPEGPDAAAAIRGAEGELDAIFSSAGQFLDDLDIIFEEGERQGYEGEGLAGIRV